MDTVNLNAGVSIKQLYADLDADKIEQIEKLSEDGFSEDELQQLEKSGIDTSLITKNSKAQSTKKTDNDVRNEAKKIKAKYLPNDVSESIIADKYSASNPELQAFKKALDDGIVKELEEEGYSKNQIIDIVNQAFKTIGIFNNKDGTYTCPYGHGEDAKEIYNEFSQQIAQIDDTELKAAKDKLAKLNLQISNNNLKLQQLEYSITALQTRIEEKIAEAIKESEEIAEDQKDDASAIVSKHLNAYTNSNGEMTYDEFMDNMSKDLDTLAGSANSKLSQAVRKIVEAQSDMATLKGYIESINTTMDLNETLTAQAKDTQTEIQKLTKQAEDGNEEAQRCDPIGFSTDKVRYDFFVDADEDGNVTNENEFLGAKNGFKEMIEADANSDGKVTADELDKKNVKVVVTKADGTQEIKNASEVFGENDSIDLSSYKSQNSETEEGNTLLGTFSVNMNGQKLDTGYQTLDNLEWLDENFEFSDEIAGTGRYVKDGKTVVQALDYKDKYNVFLNQYQNLENQENLALSKLGIKGEEIREGITKDATSKGTRMGFTVENQFKQEAKEAQEQEQAEQKAQEELEKKKLEEEEK